VGDRTYETAVADGCTSITGSLIIGDTSLTNLNGLPSLTSVGGLYIQRNDALANVDGLAALTSVGGLYIQRNDALANVDGLAALISVGNELDISHNDALANLDGLSAVTSAPYWLYIKSNRALTNIDGMASMKGFVDECMIGDNASLANLNGLSSISSIFDLWLSNNHALVNIDGLANTRILGLIASNNSALENIDGLAGNTSMNVLSIRGHDALLNIDGLASLIDVNEDELRISGNNALTDLDGLSSLSTVSGFMGLTISGNAALANINGLGSLKSTQGSLFIVGNGSLLNVDGLSALVSVGGYLRVTSNSTLCQYSVDSLLSRVLVQDSIFVHDNDGDCPPRCGDGTVNPGEECDDGGTLGGDCCSPQCDIEMAGTVCGVSSEVCDIEEVCDGTNSECPPDEWLPDSDDDGTCDDYDECPDDPSHVLAGGCGCPSALSAQDTLCREATDDCDIPESCDGSSVDCPPDERLRDWDFDGICDIFDLCPGRSDPAQNDSDADGIGDVCDLCTGGATTTRQVVKVTNFATYDDSSTAGAFLDRSGMLAAKDGDDKLTFKATLQFDAPVAPDPENNGFALMLQDATGKRILDLRIPPGAYNVTSRSGWISSKKRLLYISRTPVGGLLPKVILRSKPKNPSEVVVIVKGKKGDFAVPPVTLPLKATVSLDPTDAMTALCAEAEFPGPKPLPYCRMSGNGVAVTCK
jgi:cysteine-rich repeat protein